MIPPFCDGTGSLTEVHARVICSRFDMDGRGFCPGNGKMERFRQALKWETFKTGENVGLPQNTSEIFSLVSGLCISD